MQKPLADHLLCGFPNHLCLQGNKQHEVTEKLERKAIKYLISKCADISSLCGLQLNLQNASTVTYCAQGDARYGPADTAQAT